MTIAMESPAPALTSKPRRSSIARDLWTIFLALALAFGAGTFAALGWAAGKSVLKKIVPTTYPTVFVDPATGCHYMQLGDAVLFPRFGMDGHPMCLLSGQNQEATQ